MYEVGVGILLRKGRKEEMGESSLHRKSLPTLRGNASQSKGNKISESNHLHIADGGLKMWTC